MMVPHEDGRPEAHDAVGAPISNLDKLILAATLPHATKILASWVAEETRASFVAVYYANRASNTLRAAVTVGRAEAVPEELRLDQEEARAFLAETPIVDRRQLLASGARGGYNLLFVHPLGKYLLAVARIETDGPVEAMAPRVAGLRQVSAVYAAALAQAEERDRLVTEREKLWSLQREVAELELTLDEPELEKVLGGVVDAALVRVGGTSGCVLLAREGDEGLVLERSSYRGSLILDPATLPRVLRPRQSPLRPLGAERRFNPNAEGIAFRVFRSARPYISADLSADPHHAPLFQGARSCIAVPISSPYGGCLGVLVVESTQLNAFTLEQVSALKELVDVARTYILKARMYHATSSEPHPIVLIGIDRKTVEQALMASRFDEPVLLVGETGSGKELVARAIHRSSARGSRPFEALNCGTLRGPLALSQLFGHVKGSFTDAKEDRPGIFEIADGGTLFLDEIEKMPVETQFLLLRVIETQEFSPVGAPDRKKRVNVRLIAATNADLRKRMEEGTFLSDLYFRVSCLTLEIAPLRERRRFIPKLIHRFLQKLSAKYRRPVPEVTPRALRMFREYDYPGNVRELQNVVTQAYTVDSDGIIDVNDLPQHVAGSARMSDTSRLPVSPAADGDGVQGDPRRRIEAALRQARGSAEQAAKVYGVSRATFYRMLKHHGINARNFR